MALPPAPAPSAATPPGLADPTSAAPPDAADSAAPDDAGDDADQPQVFATILKTPDGKFILVDGDESDPDEMGGDEPGMMDQAGVDGPTLLKQLMAKIQSEGESGAEAAFTSAKKPGAPTMPPMPSGAGM